jgi:small subunit ribosomal protein S25e
LQSIVDVDGEAVFFLVVDECFRYLAYMLSLLFYHDSRQKFSRSRRNKKWPPPWPVVRERRSGPRESPGDKVENKVLMSKEQFDRLQAEVPKMKLITVSSVVDKLKVNGGLARRCLRLLAEEGKIRPVLISRSAERIYTRNVGEGDEA